MPEATLCILGRVPPKLVNHLLRWRALFRLHGGCQCQQVIEPHQVRKQRSKPQDILAIGVFALLQPDELYNRQKVVLREPRLQEVVNLPLVNDRTSSPWSACQAAFVVVRRD